VITLTRRGREPCEKSSYRLKRETNWEKRRRAPLGSARGEVSNATDTGVVGKKKGVAFGRIAALGYVLEATPGGEGRRKSPRSDRKCKGTRRCRSSGQRLLHERNLGAAPSYVVREGTIRRQFSTNDGFDARGAFRYSTANRPKNPEDKIQRGSEAESRTR